MRKVKQLLLFELPIPKHIVVINTSDLDLTAEPGIRICIERMVAVPLDKSILLDFLVGRKRGTPHASEEHAELHRLMALLNSRVRGKRFDFFGPNFAATLMRNSLREKSWIPLFLKERPNIASTGQVATDGNQAEGTPATCR